MSTYSVNKSKAEKSNLRIKVAMLQHSRAMQSELFQMGKTKDMTTKRKVLGACILISHE